MDMRKHGNIVSHERRTRITDPEAISKDRIESLITELGNYKDDVPNSLYHPITI